MLQYVENWMYINSNIQYIALSIDILMKDGKMYEMDSNSCQGLLEEIFF